MGLTNTQKRRQDVERINNLSPKLKEMVFADKEQFFDKEGNSLADRYELLLKTTDEQVRGLQGNTLMDMHTIENGRFIFTFFELSRRMQERFTTLSAEDIARLLYIGTYVAYETNRLQSDNGKKIIKKQDLKEMVGMSPKRFNQLYKRYQDEGILAENAQGEIFLETTVVYRGDLKKLGTAIAELSYTRLFRKTVRELYEQYKGTRKMGQLALVYSVIPFLNLRYNIVCYNPEETASEAVHPINVKVLADILGYQNQSKLKTALNNVKLDGEPMFTFAEDPHDRREKRIIVNPKAIYAGNGETLESLKPLFN